MANYNKLCTNTIAILISGAIFLLLSAYIVADLFNLSRRKPQPVEHFDGQHCSNRTADIVDQDGSMTRLTGDDGNELYNHRLYHKGPILFGLKKVPFNPLCSSTQPSPSRTDEDDDSPEAIFKKSDPTQGLYFDSAYKNLGRFKCKSVMPEDTVELDHNNLIACLDASDEYNYYAVQGNKCYATKTEDFVARPVARSDATYSDEQCIAFKRKDYSDYHVEKIVS
jgi:hypothetical protein